MWWWLVIDHIPHKSYDNCFSQALAFRSTVMGIPNIDRLCVTLTLPLQSL